MTKREIASLTIKLMGVFILFKTIGYVPMAFSEMTYALRSERLFVAVGMVILSVVMVGVSLAWSLVIIFFSDKFAAKIIRDDAAVEPLNSAIGKDDVMMIAISCIGLYFIISAIPSLIVNLFFYFRPSASSLWQNVFRTLVAPAVQLGLGIWLFIGSKGIVKLWKKSRS